MFVWLDLSVALLLIFLFAIAIIELSATATEMIVAMYIYWPGDSQVQPDTLVFYIITTKAFLLSDIIDRNSLEWARDVSSSDQLVALLGKMSMWELKRSVYEGMVVSYLIDLKHILA